MRDAVGIALSFAFFFGLLLIAPIFKKSLELSRKFVHIMLGNWWFILLAFFSSPWSAGVVPFTFIFINYFSVKKNKAGGLLSELERKGNSKSYGIVAYPVAMVLLVLISFIVIKSPYIGGVGLMALAYGDGFAALIGKKFTYIKFKIWGNEKTVSGCIGMFIATFLSVTAYLVIVNSFDSPIPVSLLAVFVASLAATLSEALTPSGFDNITVPLSAVGCYWLLLAI